MKDLKECSKIDLFDLGMIIVSDFNKLNAIKDPQIDMKETGKGREHVFASESNHIQISLEQCGKIGYAGIAWSFPAYKIDRTPTGVLCHEMGHIIDFQKGNPSSSEAWLAILKSSKYKVSGYEPNPAEAFAESIRLFILNPMLLNAMLPKRFEFLSAEVGLSPLHTEDPVKVLVNYGAPERQINATKKILIKFSKKD